MGYVKEQNVWVKKAEWDAIDLDEVTLGADEVHGEGDEPIRDAHKTGEIADGFSSVDFDTKVAFEAILSWFDTFDTHFESLTTRLDFMQHKQDDIITQVQQFQAY